MRCPVQDPLPLDWRVREHEKGRRVETASRCFGGLVKIAKVSGIIMAVASAVVADIEPVQPRLSLDDQ